MAKISIVELKKLKPTEPKPQLDKILVKASKVLRENTVKETIVVNENLVVGDNYELFWALSLLGVKYAPISSSLVKEISIPLEALGLFEEINPSPYKVFSNTLELLYRNWPTPLVRLETLSRNGLSVWAKLESFNPYSGSIKDRIGWYMFINKREDRAKKLLYEATSTNTGMALAAMLLQQ